MSPYRGWRPKKGSDNPAPLGGRRGKGEPDPTAFDEKITVKSDQHMAHPLDHHSYEKLTKLLYGAMAGFIYTCTDNGDGTYTHEWKASRSEKGN